MKKAWEIVDEIKTLRKALKDVETRDKQNDSLLILSRIHALEWVMGYQKRTQLPKGQK
ncbi:MAG: hypothetical protein WC325_11420 [Candidatus Bathyarchaeia archaeon]